MPDDDVGFDPAFQLAAQEFASRCFEQGLYLRAIEVQRGTHLQRFDIGLKEPASQVAAPPDQPGSGPADQIPVPQESTNGPVS